jgi:tetratricopeptide (TPR) repeat protein
MPTLSLPRILACCLVIASLTASVHAQEPQGPPPGGQTPQPNPTPTPQPQPRQPNNIPTPQPTMPSQQMINIRGRIITGVHSGGPAIMEIRIETDGGQPVGFAYADSAGEFNFQKQGFSLDQTLYVVVNIEGFKPHRERIFGGFGRESIDAFVTIFLERESSTTAVNRGGSPVVDLKQLRAKIPGKAVDEYEKAMKEAVKGNRTKAVEGLLRAVKLAPDFYEAQHTLGVQYLALQKLPDAESALLRARDLSPKAAEPLMNLGALYYQRGEAQIDAGQSDEAAATFEKAAEILEESIRRNPLSPSSHSNLGAALYKIGEYERAETVLKKALELDENEHNARLMLINVYTKEARFSDALQQANAFLEKNPKAPQRPSLEAIKQQIEKILAK